MSPREDDANDASPSIKDREVYEAVREDGASKAKAAAIANAAARDSREKESKKYGLKKARKAPQYSKR